LAAIAPSTALFFLSAEQERVHGRTLEEALAWRLLRRIARELKVGPFLACRA
jgi:hypothetical protein